MAANLNLAKVAEVMFQTPGITWFELHERHCMIPFSAKKGIAGASDEMGVRFTRDFRVIISNGSKTEEFTCDKPVQAIAAACKKLGVTLPRILKDRIEEPDLT